MATTAWYIRTTGNDLNSGGSDSDTARVTRDSGTPGVVTTSTTLTDTGATFQTSGVLVGDAVNFQIAGVSTIAEIASVDSETVITLAGAGVANGSYNYRIGGARALLTKVCQTGAGQNVVFAANDTVGCKGGTYTENTITPAAACRIYSSDDVEAVFDGTGGAGGSHVFGLAQNVVFYKIAAVNGVAAGFNRTANTPIMIACRAQANGTSGFGFTTVSANLTFCKAAANAGVGFVFSNGNSNLRNCHADGNTSHGMTSSTGILNVNSCIFSDNGADGWNQNGTVGTHYVVVGNTFEGNTSDGWELATTAGLALGSCVRNNLFTNNANKGVNSSGGAQAAWFDCDYNLYFGNGAARANFTTGTNDKTTDPAYVSASTDDYSILSTGGAYKAGYNNFMAPTKNLLNIGAVPGPGSTELYLYTSAQASGGVRTIFHFGL